MEMGNVSKKQQADQKADNNRRPPMDKRHIFEKKKQLTK